MEEGIILPTNQVVSMLSVSHSRVQLFVIPWTVACQAPLSMEFFGQEYWSGLPSPSPGDLPDPGTELRSPALQADSLPSEPPGKPGCIVTKLSEIMFSCGGSNN